MAAPALKNLTQRLLFISLLGVFAAIAFLPAYWNWYGFPREAIAIGLIEWGVGGLLMGLVFAKLIK